MFDEYFDTKGDEDKAPDGFYLSLEEMADLLSNVNAKIGKDEGNQAYDCYGQAD